MRGRWFTVLALLAACAAPEAPPAPMALRNPAAPVASQANVTLEGLAGEWLVVQGAGIAPGTRVTVTDQGLQLGEALFVQSDAGRFARGPDRLWVHWLDVGQRTAALGDPDGRRVWIMDRTAQSSADRITAAREILDWYGYDLTRMRGL
ncbi:MAG TPA: lipocalin family protein [Paracoccaceae bacterium]|nr:lipocalin family protein [Paracoccaceae bacterium]